VGGEESKPGRYLLPTTMKLKIVMVRRLSEVVDGSECACEGKQALPKTVKEAKVFAFTRIRARKGGFTFLRLISLSL
jgi:hypothetical protein